MVRATTAKLREPKHVRTCSVMDYDFFHIRWNNSANFGPLTKKWPRLPFTRTGGVPQHPAENCRQRRLWVLRMPTLLLNSFKMSNFQPQVFYFCNKILGQEQNFATGYN